MARSYKAPISANVIVLAGLIHTLLWNYTGVVEQPLLVALLSHATAAVLASVALGWWGRRRGDTEFADRLHRWGTRSSRGTNGHGA